MPSSWMWHRVGLVTVDFSEECIVSFRVERIRELETILTSAVTAKYSNVEECRLLGVSRVVFFAACLCS
jgi:hypothetical protein